MLFSYLEGTVLALDEKNSFEYGKLTANLHKVTVGWNSRYPRFHLDIDHLLLQPLEHIKKGFTKFKSEISFIEEITKKVINTIQHLPNHAPYYGVCHGDHFGNSFLNNITGQTFYDFDSFGEGWRIYDVAQFYWAIKLKLGLWSEQYLCSDEVLWQAFLNGYQSVRSLAESKIKAIPAFLIARAIWGLGLQPANSEHFGIAWLDDIFHLSYNFIQDIVNNYSELDFRT